MRHMEYNRARSGGGRMIILLAGRDLYPRERQPAVETLQGTDIRIPRI